MGIIVDGRVRNGYKFGEEIILAFASLVLGIWGRWEFICGGKIIFVGTGWNVDVIEFKMVVLIGLLEWMMFLSVVIFEGSGFEGILGCAKVGFGVVTGDGCCGM